MPDDNFNPPRRSRNLSDADIQALLEAFQSHSCKFTDTEVADVKKVARFFEACENQILSGIRWFFIAVIGGFVYLLYSHGYFWKGK